MGLLLEPIKKDLNLSDTQLGFLTGIAFGLFYAVLGLPIARWADRGNRVTITSLAIGLWGVTVMSCLLVTNYTQLLCARVAAAIGEAGCKPPTLSLLGDYFPRAPDRTRAMAFWWLGAPLATLISFIVGGKLNELFGWRFAFFLMGIPGLILALLVKLTLVEPRSKSASGQMPAAVERVSLKEVLLVLWHRRSCRHLTIALVLLLTMGFGLTPWNTAFMIRSHGMGTAELGVWMGLISSLGGFVGLLAGAYAANHWFENNEKAQMRMSALAIAGTVPCYAAFLLVPQKHTALVMLLPWTLVANLFVGPVYAVIQRLVPDSMRATIMAVIMLLYNLIGMGLGPQLVGILSDQLHPRFGTDSLRYAMLALCTLALWSAYHFWQVSLSVQKDLLAASTERDLVANPVFVAMDRGPR